MGKTMNSSEPVHVLIVEDDESLASWIADYLVTHGFQVTVATQGDHAIDLIREDIPDAVVLDLNLPVVDGIEVCRQVRDFYLQPIIMLTARDADEDEIKGLQTGADDYLAKPVKPKVLLARLHALLRRGTVTGYSDNITIGELHIDIASRSVYLNEQLIDVSSHEYDLLLLLASRVGETLTRQELVSEIRGIDYNGFDRSVDICISRLRRKLGDSGAQPRRIKTLRGLGYLMAADAW